MGERQLWDAGQIAAYRGTAECGVYKWLARKGIRAVGHRGFGRVGRDLFDARQVMAAHCGEPVWHLETAGA